MCHLGPVLVSAQQPSPEHDTQLDPGGRVGHDPEGSEHLRQRDGVPSRPCSQVVHAAAGAAYRALGSCAPGMYES